MSDQAGPLGIGVVGFGSAGQHHADRLRLRHDCQLVAICDERPRRRALAESIHRCQIYDQASTLLADPRAEVVFVCSDPGDRSVLAIQAIQAGKHTVVEPPMCLSTTEGESILEASRHSDRMLTVAQLRRWDEDFLTAFEAVRSGQLGDLLTLKRVTWCYSSVLQQDDERRAYDRSGGSKPALADRPSPLAGTIGGTEPPQPDPALGVLDRYGAHDFDQLLLLVRAASTGSSMSSDRDTVANSPAGLPQAVSVYTERHCRRWSSEQDDAFLALVRFEDGLTAQIEVDLSALAPLSTGWMISGRRGAYADFQLYTPEAGEVIETPLPRAATDWDQFYSGLYKHLRDGEPLHVLPEEALEVVRLLEAARRSGRSGQAVHLEPSPQAIK